MFDLSLICAIAMVFALACYVMLDGFDLGVGLILPFERLTTNRQVIISTITPTWDGNETWLIMAAIILFGAFTPAYAILLPALYIPAVAMLLGLCLRGAAIEFQDQPGWVGGLWQILFVIGSVTATLHQGLILGALLWGIPVADGQFAGSQFDIYSLFNLNVAVATAAAYAVVGARWLRLKQPGVSTSLLKTASRAAILVLLACGALALVLSLWRHPELQQVLFNRRGLFLALIALILLCAVMLWRAVAGTNDRTPLFWSGVVVGASLLVFVCLVAPYVVPYHLTYQQASSAASSQTVVLIGVGVVMPVVLLYSGFAYHVFRGKTPPAGWGDGDGEAPHSAS